MKKKKTNIIKFISFLLLIFSFNLSVNAETTKIYYADDRGIRKFAEKAPTGYPKNEGGVTVYSSRSVSKYKPTLYYVCALDSESTETKLQQAPCGAEGSEDKTLVTEKRHFYSCVSDSSDSVEGNEVADYKESDGDVCKKYSDWTDYSSTKPAGYDEKNTDLYRSSTFYYWYKEVPNGTTISFENNKVLYDAIKNGIETSDIKNAEINFLENPLRIVASDITKVEKLYLDNNSIVSIDQLEYFTGLTDLDLRSNDIEKIDAIKNLVNLEYLKLYNNAIISVEPIIGLKKLKSLRLNLNEITNLGLLKKIENYSSIEKSYYNNDFKKSGLIKNWSEFVDELLNYESYYMNYTIKNTKDSLIFYENNSEAGKFEFKNNILKFVSGDSDTAVEMLGFLLAIGYSKSDLVKAANCADEDDKCYFSKFGDYLKLNVTYKDNNNTIDKVDFSFDLNYFFGEAASKNPKTGVSNALVLLGITFMCSAIGFVVMYKHKTGIQL